MKMRIRNLITTAIIIMFAPITLCAKVVAGEELYEGGKKIVLKDTVDLQGKTIRLRPGSTIICKNGIFQNGRIVFSNKCKILGNNTTWYRVKLCGEKARKICIQDLTLDYDLSESMDTPLRFIRVKGLTMKKLSVYGFYHRYDKGRETEKIDGLKYHVAVFHDCTKVIIDGMTIKNSAPEGPFFHLCRKLQLNNIDISDVDNVENRNLWSAIHFFYCTDVSLTHSEFRKRNMGPESGSTINACCHNLRIDDCLFEGSKGVDFSNEMKEIDFSSENVTMTNSKILNSFYGIYTGPNPGILKHLQFENCEVKVRVDKEIEGAIIYGQHIQDLSFKNCHLSGPIVLKIVSEQQYSGEIGDYYFDSCFIDDNCYNKGNIRKNRLVYAYNSGINAGIVFFNNCKIDYGNRALSLSSNWGKQLDVIMERSSIVSSKLILNDGNNNTNIGISDCGEWTLKPLIRDNATLMSKEIELKSLRKER